MGYWGAQALGFGETSSRTTMAIETSMKSSAFGFLLAKLHFGAFAARVPSAVSVVWMALTGSSMAVAWRFMPGQAGQVWMQGRPLLVAALLTRARRSGLGGGNRSFLVVSYSSFAVVRLPSSFPIMLLTRVRAPPSTEDHRMLAWSG